MVASNRLIQTLGIVRFNKEVSVKRKTAFLRISLRLQAKKHLPSFLQFGWEFNADSRCKQTHQQLPEHGIAVLHVKLQVGTECSHVLRKTAALHPLLWTTAPVKSSCPVWAWWQSGEMTSLGEEGEQGKQLWKKKGWFYHGLVSWIASLGQCWVPEHAEKKFYPNGDLGGRATPLAAASC